MVMEDLVHYGELSAVLWQMDKEAPYLAFWRYMHNKEHLTPSNIGLGFFNLISWRVIFDKIIY